jgi:hypothetical protein
MVQSEENGNNNGKKISFSVSEDLNKQIEDYSEDKNVSVSTFVKQAVEDKIQWCNAKEVLKSECESENGKLNPDSRFCRKVEQHFER